MFPFHARLRNTTISYTAEAIWDTEAPEFEVRMLMPSSSASLYDCMGAWWPQTVRFVRAHYSAFTLGHLLSTAYQSIPDAKSSSLWLVCHTGSVRMRKKYYPRYGNLHFVPEYEDESAALERSGVVHACCVSVVMERKYHLEYDRDEVSKVVAIDGTAMVEYNMMHPPILVTYEEVYTPVCRVFWS